MSYTPTTWTTGDTITASAMNKIENGIANAGGGGTAWVTISASGYDASTHAFARVFYALYDSNSSKWIVYNDYEDSWLYIFGYNQPNGRLIPPQALPEDENIGLFITCYSDEISVTGDIDDEPTTVYLSYGSVVYGDTHRIYGSGSITFIAT